MTSEPYMTTDAPYRRTEVGFGTTGSRSSAPTRGRVDPSPDVIRSSDTIGIRTVADKLVVVVGGEDLSPDTQLTLPAHAITALIEAYSQADQKRTITSMLAAMRGQTNAAIDYWLKRYGSKPVSNRQAPPGGIENLRKLLVDGIDQVAAAARDA